MLHFIETPTFTKAIKALFDDEAYHQIQIAPLKDPTQGQIIQGTGGLRKIRFGRSGGKSGGVHILYYYADERGCIYLFAVYPKYAKDNITDAQRLALKRMITTLKQELKNGQ